MIRDPQIFPDLPGLSTGMTFPPVKYRYRVISLGFTWQAENTGGSRWPVLNQAFNIGQILINRQTSASPVIADSIARVTFGHYQTQTNAGLTAPPLALFVLTIPIPYDQFIEPGHTLSFELVNVGDDDRITNITLVIDDDVATPPKKHLTS